ncbi:ATP-binding cassette domain-containing protein [Paramaledivibacter caminithermalis]|jgi:tungstate transport system ATP-binding protein|uniref:Carbohydrate ABC transporter ATP-binding protein, CUT1 family n=1 Tax=Paramaledivibacter caminithermalis (strain DSM 15212 / CIP 107654 / DViRD3) TaxID=1121301 RepID=A0A1M6KW43_PARC5|nr:ATP-binding cassette domain-containing protein [Paramaledivibacter caminithermalis]SHJ63185.1 carbohydrate ABC transporter ATP-binding protein, CUT1 family [Paramaledivibacter caminithermalis DSM 15212]
MNIEIQSLIKTYNQRQVLNIKSLSLEKGKIYGIIGPNGAGKSTMLRIIAGLEEAKKGTILYNKKHLNGEIIKNLTYLNQKPYLLRTSVFNNIAYPLKLRKYKKETLKKKVIEIVKEFNIFDLRHQPATNLSGGEAQKVALARALIFEPELLLLDEPTANIDPNSLELIEKKIIKRNREKNTTIIIITHNIGQAKRLCDEIIFIREGEIVEYGKTNQVISNPKCNEMKRFLSVYI